MGLCYLSNYNQNNILQDCGANASIINKQSQTCIYDTGSQVTLMKPELLGEYEAVPASEGFSLIGINRDHAMKCVGKGKCPPPFENITGYHVQGVEDNIIADKDVKKEWSIERVYSEDNNQVIVDAIVLTNLKDPSIQVMFNCVQGQFVADVTVTDVSDTKFKCYLNSKYYQRLGLTKDTIARMVRVEKLHQAVSYLSLGTLSMMIKQDVFEGCTLNTDDVRNYFQYMHDRSCTGCNSGKRTCDYQSSIPEHISYCKVGQLLCMDLIFLSSVQRVVKKEHLICGLLCVDAYSLYKTIFWLDTRGEHDLQAAVYKCIQYYRAHKHTVGAVRMDHEGSSENLKSFLGMMNVQLEQPHPGRHVVQVESTIRYLKTLWRSTILGAKFGIPVPKYLYKAAFNECVRNSNLALTSHNEVVNPYYMFLGCQKISYREFEAVQFLDVVTTYNIATHLKKDDESRVDVGLVVGRLPYPQTGVEILNLRTKKLIQRGVRSIVVIEPTEEIRQQIRSLDGNKEVEASISIPRVYVRRHGVAEPVELLDDVDEKNIQDKVSFSEMEAAALKEYDGAWDDDYMFGARNRNVPVINNNLIQDDGLAAANDLLDTVARALFQDNIDENCAEFEQLDELISSTNECDYDDLATTSIPGAISFIQPTLEKVGLQPTISDNQYTSDQGCIDANSMPESPGKISAADTERRGIVNFEDGLVVPQGNMCVPEEKQHGGTSCERVADDYDKSSSVNSMNNTENESKFTSNILLYLMKLILLVCNDIII